MDGKRVVKLLDPPPDSQPGDRVHFEGYEHDKYGGKLLVLHGSVKYSISISSF